MASEQALGSNEALFREVNERVRELAGGQETLGAEPVAFLCECATLECGGTVTLTLGEYEEARSSPRTFFVVPGHEDARIERVVRREPAWLLVEKVDEAGEVADALDPRD